MPMRSLIHVDKGASREHAGAQKWGLFLTHILRFSASRSVRVSKATGPRSIAGPRLQRRIGRQTGLSGTPNRPLRRKRSFACGA